MPPKTNRDSLMEHNLQLTEQVVTTAGLIKQPDQQETKASAIQEATTITSSPPEDGPEITDAAAYRTVEDLVYALLDPPQKAYLSADTVKVDMVYVLSVLGENHFDRHTEKGIRSLKKNSKVKTHGRQAGLPAAFYNWLCEHPMLEPHMSGPLSEFVILDRAGFKQ